MRRWSAWTLASTLAQAMSGHDVISGIRVDAANPYLVALATPLLVTSIPQQAVPTSASSLSPGFPRGVRFLGNPTPACHAPDGLLPGWGEAGRGYFVPPRRLPVGVGVSAVRRGPWG